MQSTLEFAFYVNRNGWRSRKDFIVHWEGAPTGFGRWLHTTGLDVLTEHATQHFITLTFSPLSPRL
jgi:hypothetical protein